MVETHSADVIQPADMIHPVDAMQPAGAIQHVDTMQPAEGLSATCPVPFSPDEVSRWERKGRGLAVFRCPDSFSLPEIESRPGTPILVDPGEDREIPGEPDRIVLKLTSRSTPHLNSLVNRIVLPAYRRYIPLYLFAAWNEEELDTGAVRIPDKVEIEAAMLPLLKEQLRTLLAFTCAVFRDPEALPTSRKPWLTPVEVLMHDRLTRAGLPHRLHVQLGAACVDALVGDSHDGDPHDGDPHDGAVAVEIDGRPFDRDDRIRRMWC